ncbi:MAG: SRPBCC family protein [Gammaproteobacteria bacterium]|nr:SRPBCC family protein [Gammaproteobacteria bacterium]
MKFIKILLGILVALAVLFVIGGMLLPSEQHVERSVVVNAEPSEVFLLVNDFREFNKWSPWADIDPDGTRYEFSGPAAGVGSKLSWSSEHPDVGSGAQEIVDSQPNRMVKARLTFEGFDSPSYATYTLEPTDGGTRVSWAFDSNLDSMLGRYLGVMMEKWVGADYERGLARLKELAEA